MSWITLKTTSTRWEAELMQQLLASYDIPSRVIPLGIGSYFGDAIQTVLKVKSQDKWMALLVLSSPEDDILE